VPTSRLVDNRPLGWKRVTWSLARLGRGTLVVVTLFLALIGFLHLTGGTAVRHVRGVATDGVPIAVTEPQFSVIVAMMTGASLSAGNRVELMQNGDGRFDRLWADLPSARQSITLQLYYGAPGRMADTLGSILVDRARAGVRVFVLYDAFGIIDIPANQRNALRAAGVIVEPFRPIRLATMHLAQNRSHVRGIVIDSRIGWTGGFGIDDKWFGDGRTGPGARPTCGSRGRRSGNCRRRSPQRGRKPPGSPSLAAQRSTDRRTAPRLRHYSTRLPRWTVPLPSAFTPSPLPARATRSTSPTPISRRTDTLSTFWGLPPGEASTSES